MIHYNDMVTRQTRTYLQAGILGILLAAAVSISSTQLSASVFGGGTVQEGILAAQGVGGIVTGNVNEVIGNIIVAILSIVTTIAVLTIVIAGMYLVLSIGDEGQKDKAKKIIQYTVVGIIVILLAQAIIDLVFKVFQGNAGGAAQIVGDVVVKIILAIVNIVTTIAVLMIVIAGLYLIFSNGDEGQKDKAKKIIIYTIIGIVVILFARVIVQFANNLFG